MEVSRDKKLICGLCNKHLVVDKFSNKQFKRYQRDNTIKPNCLECTKQADGAAAIEEVAKEAGEEGKKKGKASKEVEKEVADPSSQYLFNPMHAPIISDFKRFFKKHYYFQDHEVHMDKKTRWRTAVKLAVRGEESAGGFETKIGLFMPGTHKVIDCTQSLAHHTQINKAIGIIQEVMKSLKLTGYIEGNGADETLNQMHKSYVRYLLCSVERSSGRVQLSIVWNASRFSTAGNAMLQEFLDALLAATSIPGYAGPPEKRSNMFHSIYVNFYPASKHCNAISGREQDDWVLKFGQEFVIEKVSTDMKPMPPLCFPPFVFRQANIDGFTFIIQEIRKWVKEFAQLSPLAIADATKARSESSGDVEKKIEFPVYCLELYGGVGTIGLNCLDYLQKLSCCDENPNNQKCFYASVKKLPKPWQPKACYSTHAANVVSTNLDIFKFDLIIVDPPRKGLDEDTLRSLIYLKDPNSSEMLRRKKTVMFEEEFVVKDTEDKTTDGEVFHHNLRRLIYISCGFEAFKRDCDILTGRTYYELPVSNPEPAAAAGALPTPQGKKIKFGEEDVEGFEASNGGNQRYDYSKENEANRVYWQLTFVKGYVLFPGSNHIETLAIFDRVMDNSGYNDDSGYY